MNGDLKQRVIDEVLELAGHAEIPSHAITIQDLMKGTENQKPMSESSAYRLLRKLHRQCKLQRARGPRNAMYYWPVEMSDNG